MLDFILNQPETEEQFEEEVFGGFSNKEYNGEGNPACWSLHWEANNMFNDLAFTSC